MGEQGRLYYLLYKCLFIVTKHALPQSNSQHDMQCLPVNYCFTAKAPCKSINKKLRHGIAQRGMALHWQKPDTHTVSESGCQGKVTKQFV